MKFLQHARLEMGVEHSELNWGVWSDKLRQLLPKHLDILKVEYKFKGIGLPMLYSGSWNTSSDFF